LAVFEYSKLTGLPEEQLMEQFRQELGTITPKVGVGGAVFDEEGKILLIRRHDDQRWTIPAGAAELHETPEEGAIREIREETGLDVKVDGLIGVFHRLAGTFGQSFSIYSIYYHCLPTGGSLQTSRESLEVGFFNHREITDWHQDSDKRAEICYQYWIKK
jgi:ADP-ribose pyrophosphatase YjhB (NUDIX family)